VNSVNRVGGAHKAHILVKIDILLPDSLEVKNPMKKTKAGLARSVILSRAGREDLMEKVAFDQRHEGDKKVSHMDVWGRAFRQRREQSKGGIWLASLGGSRHTSEAEAQRAWVSE